MKTDPETDDKVKIPMPPLVRCSFAVAVSIFALVWTESNDPGGSAIALLILGLLLFYHLKLLFKLPQDPPYPGNVKRPGFFLGLVIILIIGVCTQFMLKGQKEIYEKGVSPYDNVHLGAITQIIPRLEQGTPLYTNPIERAGYEEKNGYLTGASIPYAIARNRGWDWRYTSLVSIALLAGLLTISGVLICQNCPNGDIAFKALFALFLAGVSWLILPAVRPYLQWGYTIALWPVIAGVGVCLCRRWNILAAILTGWLAAMNPGWILMTPVILAFLWKENRKQFPLLVVLMGIWPLLSIGAGRDSWMLMWEGVLGNLFTEGNKLREAGNTWHYTSLHGIGDMMFLHLRYPLYIFTLLALVVLTGKIIREDSTPKNIQLIAFSSFLLLITGPVCFTHHWMSHGILLASLIPGSWPPGASKGKETTIWAKPQLLGGAVATCLLVILVAQYILIPQPASGNGVYQQKADKYLLNGFWVGDSTHTWGRGNRLAVGFPVKTPKKGVLELDLGTLGGDFTPFNPIEVWVNGTPKGVIRILPGDYRHAQIPLNKNELHRGMNTLQLQTAWSRVPKSLHANNDLRTLSLCYRGLSIKYF